MAAAEPKKRRGCLGCSFPILVIVVIVGLAILVVGFMAGPLGKSIIGDIGLPSWLSVPAPEPHLPAPALFHIFGLPITNTILAGWLTVVVLVLSSWLITRRMKVVPGRLQSAFEFVLGWIYDLCKSIAGEANGRRFFPFVCTIFLFVLFNAWLSLIPGFGSITYGGEHELIRGANTDANTPLAIAISSFVFVAFFGLKTFGIGWFRQYFNFGPFFHSLGQIFRGKLNVMNIFSGAVGIFVGGLELLSMFIRIISFTFRLFGNMTAGEILLLIAAFLVPWVLALPFYGLELLIGLVQALIFSGLTLVFATMAVASHQDESH